MLTAPCPSCGATNHPGEKFCGSCGICLSAGAGGPAATAPSEPAAAAPTGERRQLTVVFCDLVGSTLLSQQLDDEEWRDLIEIYEHAAAEVVGRWSGHVAKNLGDGLLIYFGWPNAREDDPERAVRAGLAILEAMDRLNAERTADGPAHFAVRVGIHTGPVVISQGGEVFGESANLAARVQGEAGVGKSRLVYQFKDRLASVPHTWLECGASPYTDATPFHPVIQLVAQGLALGANDSAARKLEKLQRGLGALAKPEPVALLATLLGLPSPPTPLAMSPDLQRRKTIDLLVQWNLAISAVQPLVVLVEDLHWFDVSSLEILERLVAQSATARVLVLATAHSELAAPWPARENATTLQLARLGARHVRDMIGALGGTALPGDTLEALIARAGGVPLYIEELTKCLVEPGGARGVEAIPATLADSLMGRLDRLSSAKEVAQRAAVLGREFSYGFLAAVAGMEEASLRHGLARLVEAEIVFERGQPPLAAYSFKHALVQEAAYGSLLKRSRQQLHGRALDALAEQFPERLASEPEVAARHAEAAGRIDEAIAYYQRAGEHAQQRSAHQEAIRHLRHAIALLTTQSPGTDRDAREVVLQLALGAPLTAALGYSHPEVEAAYERARDLCDTIGDTRRLGLALIGLAIFYFTRGEVERGRTLAARVLAESECSGDSELVMRGHLDVAMCEYYQGKFASSLAHSETAHALYAPDRHHAGVSVIATDPGVGALAFSAWGLWALGWPDRAVSRAEESAALARRLEHPLSVAMALFHQMVVHWLRRDVAHQRERAAELVTLSESLGFPLFLAVGRTWHALARVNAGDPDALADVEAGLTLAAATGTRAAVPALFALLAEAYLMVGRVEDGLGAVNMGIGLSVQTGQPLFDADLHRLRGELVLADSGAPADAAVHFERALEVARAQEAKGFELRAALSFARLRQRQGQRSEARALLAPVYGWFTEGFAASDLASARTLLAELQ